MRLNSNILALVLLAALTPGCEGEPDAGQDQSARLDARTDMHRDRGRGPDHRRADAAAADAPAPVKDGTPDKAAPNKDSGSPAADKTVPPKDQGKPPCNKTLCGGACVDTSSSCAHCGTCNNACSADEICCNGKLVSSVGAPGAPLVTGGPCGALIYGRYANEGQSNKVHRLPDFSFAGYRGGGVPLPSAPVKATVSPVSGDDRATIQTAIDKVGKLSPAASGLRGAVLLKKGTYQVSDTLYINKSGVVLRGEGQHAGGTVLVATKKAQHTLIHIKGSGSGLGEVSGTKVKITSSYVPVGSRSFQVSSAAKFKVGHSVVVLRTPNSTWINALGMNKYGWTPSKYTIGHERRVIGISGNNVTVDIPLVDTLESKYGGGSLYRASITGRIQECGVEDLRLDSVYSGSTDEKHGWFGVQLSRAENSWVSRVTVRHFGYAAVSIHNESNFNTVQEVAMVDPVSKIEGGRRYPFNVTDGLGNLFQRCYSRDGRHSFVTGSGVTGPNVWLDCLAEKCHADEGPHHRWATGLLFDNTKSSELNVQNRATSGTGHGWAGAQVLFYNAEANNIICDAPKGAMNWAVGCKGSKSQGKWAPGEPYGMWETQGKHVSPRSLYLSQLELRKGKAAVDSVTTPGQRAGAIWSMLSAWAGNGKLASFGPDPTCKYGILSGKACCAASCGKCGGTGCSQLPGGASNCCTGSIAAANKSCTKHPAPCVMP